jgi:hypothetical protein
VAVALESLAGEALAAWTGAMASEGPMLIASTFMARSCRRTTAASSAW